MQRRIPSIVASAGLAVALLAGCAAGPQEADTTPNEDAQEIVSGTVRIAIPADAANFWDLYIAQEEGFFEKWGITADLTITPGAAATIAALSGGAADVGTPFAEQGLATISQGAPMRVIAGQTNAILASVVSQPNITEVADLKGASIATTSVDDVLTLLMDAELEKAGIGPGEYERVITGSTPQRFQSLQSGAVDAVQLAPPFNFLATAGNYPELMTIAQPGMLSAHFATDSFRTGKAELATQYVRAIQDASAWFVDPANEKRAIEILVQRTEVAEPIVKQTYDLYISNDAFLAGAPIQEDLVRESIRLIAPTGRIDANADPADFIDGSFLERASRLK